MAVLGAGAMKRSAAEAFAAPAFLPDGAAMLDPKAYFAQWQQVAAQAAPAAAAAAPAASVVPEVLQQVKDASAVKCAGIVKDKGENFTTAVQIEALHTMALKSSFKLREELVKQPHVRRLAQRVLDIARRPPPGLSLEQLAKAAWSLARLPDDIRGEAQAFLGPTATMLGGMQPTQWEAETASQVLWSLAKTDAIVPHKHVASKVVADIGKRWWVTSGSFSIGGRPGAPGGRMTLRSEMAFLALDLDESWHCIGDPLVLCLYCSCTVMALSPKYIGTMLLRT